MAQKRKVLEIDLLFLSIASVSLFCARLSRHPMALLVNAFVIEFTFVMVSMQSAPTNLLQLEGYHGFMNMSCDVHNH